MKKGLLACLLLLAGSAIYAQVGIGTTTPDVSSALDIKAADKGLLVPRLTAAQRAAIASPATGLLVIQTDGAQGFYYNAGTPAAPNWLNLSAYTLQQNINTNGKFISGDGTNNGLQLAANGAVVGKGTYTGNSSILTEAGAGSKMIWYPGKSAFRAGRITGDHWNNMNIGNVSTGIGYNVLPSGAYAIAMGYNTTASGLSSTAMGSFVSTNNKFGSFIIGDGRDALPNLNNSNNEMLMRFANGYHLYASNSATPALDITAHGDIAYSGSLNMGIQYVYYDFSLPGNNSATIPCSCPSGTKLIGGGGGHRDWNSAARDIRVDYSGPNPDNSASAWRVIVTNTSGSARGIRVYAICAKVN